MKKQYIEIGQYQVARIEKQFAPSSVFGLSTEGLNTCLGLGLTSQNKIMLMHFDTNVDTHFIAKQIQWIADEEYTLHIGYKKATLENAIKSQGLGQSFGLDGFLLRLTQSLQEKNLPVWQSMEKYNLSGFEGSFIVNLQGKAFENSKLSRKRAPQQDKRFRINFSNYLNSEVPNKLYAQLELDLVYDTDKWTEMPGSFKASNVADRNKSNNDNNNPQGNVNRMKTVNEDTVQLSSFPQRVSPGQVGFWSNSDSSSGDLVLYAESIEKSLVILIRGTDGVALVYLTSHLSMDQVIRAFEKVGNLQEWRIAYDPNHHESPKASSVKDEYARIYRELKQEHKKKLNIKLVAAQRSYVALTKQWEIKVNDAPQL